MSLRARAAAGWRFLRRPAQSGVLVAMVAMVAITGGGWTFWLSVFPMVVMYLAGGLSERDERERRTARRGPEPSMPEEQIRLANSLFHGTIAYRAAVQRASRDVALALRSAAADAAREWPPGALEVALLAAAEVEKIPHVDPDPPKTYGGDA